jgi:acyl carrier protein
MDQGVSLESFLISAIATTCNVDPGSVGLQTRIADLGMDSLGLISMVSQIGVVWSVEISADETMEFLEVARVEDFLVLARRIAARGGGAAA